MGIAQDDPSFLSSSETKSPVDTVFNVKHFSDSHVDTSVEF